MREVFGDFWTQTANVKLITTNGDINRDGRAVMGRGIAAQATTFLKGIADCLADVLRLHGNHVCYLLEHNGVMYFSFPVKHHWHEMADLDLIRESCAALQKMAIAMDDWTYLLPRPGCGAGGLAWDEVRQILEDVGLPDNVIVIERGRLGDEVSPPEGRRNVSL